MDPLERLLRIGREPPPEPWSDDQFRQAAADGKQRWLEVKAFFGIQYAIFEDAIGIVAPDFKLSLGEEQAAHAAAVPRMRNVGSRIAVSFLRWERCPATAGHSNPYEPWLEIWEHGGAFSIEHGEFVDVYDAELMPIAWFSARRR